MAQAPTSSMRAPTADATAGVPQVRTIGIADVRDAMRKGIDDFKAMPHHFVFLVTIYALVSLLAIGFTFNYDMLPLMFPLIGGSAILGPFAAIGLYELSRRREQGLDTSWWHMFGFIRFGSILALGVVLMAAFVVWLLVALAIFRATFGTMPVQPADFASQLLTTGHGWTLILVGNAVGAVFALIMFTMTVVSFPMLVDKRVGLGTAVGTSVRAVLANPLPMLAWAFIVVASLLVGAIPFLIGLAVVLPVLGHATWHLYRKVVER